jgi:hypothetical protein
VWWFLFLGLRFERWRTPVFCLFVIHDEAFFSLLRFVGWARLVLITPILALRVKRCLGKVAVRFVVLCWIDRHGCL